MGASKALMASSRFSCSFAKLESLGTDDRGRTVDLCQLVRVVDF